MFGAGAGGPPGASAMDPMDSYNAGYAARLQQALQGSAIAQGTGDQTQNLPTDDTTGQPSDLGPDNYRNSALAPIGRYETPFSEIGINSGITIALKMIAEITAEYGSPRCMMLRTLSGPLASPVAA